MFYAHFTVAAAAAAGYVNILNNIQAEALPQSFGTQLGAKIQISRWICSASQCKAVAALLASCAAVQYCHRLLHRTLPTTAA
jgi:hypothetical protein